MTNHTAPSDPFESLPEAKLELIDGRLIVGHSSAGTRLLLAEILAGWSAAAAIALTGPERVWEALHRVYPDLPFADNTTTAPALDTLWPWAWATPFYLPADLETSRRGPDGGHRVVRRTLLDQLWIANDYGLGGFSIGPDFVMQLGDDAFTPDVLLLLGDSLNRLCDYYVDGPADLAIEVLLPAHITQDRDFKRHRYAQGGVPEYWLIDPQNHEVIFLRLMNGTYQPVHPDPGDIYRSPHLPGLAFYPDRLWKLNYHAHFEPSVFLVEGGTTKPPHYSFREGSGYGRIPFAPHIDLEPMPIRFEDFISWCPEAKFEYWDDRIQMAGIREFLGLLLMTVGLVETVKLLPARQWVDALLVAANAARQDAARKAAWWEIARQAGALLRERFGARELHVAGDLIRSTPLNYWSRIEFIAPDLPEFSHHEAGWVLYQTFMDPRVDLLEDWRAERCRAEGTVILEQS